MKLTGKVKFFGEKGYGFIVRDDGQGDVFVHRNDLPPGITNLHENQVIMFEVAEGKRGTRAVNITVDSAPHANGKPGIRDLIEVLKQLRDVVDDLGDEKHDGLLNRADDVIAHMSGGVA